MPHEMHSPHDHLHTPLDLPSVITDIGNMQETLIRIIRDNATHEASHYYLKSRTDTTKRIPENGGFSLNPFQKPSADYQLAGSYDVFYLDPAMGAVEARFPVTPPRITVAAEVAPVSAPPPSKPAANSPASTALVTDPRHRRDLIDAGREKMAIEIAENKQILSKRLRLAHDQAEQLILNRYYRHEIQHGRMDSLELVGAVQQLQMQLLQTQGELAARQAQVPVPQPQQPSLVQGLLELAPLATAFFGGRGRRKNRVLQAIVDDDEEDDEGGDGDEGDDETIESVRAQMMKLEKRLKAAKEKIARKQQKKAGAKQKISPPPKKRTPTKRPPKALPAKRGK